jgi:hypothetical protein
VRAVLPAVGESVPAAEPHATKGTS